MVNNIVNLKMNKCIQNTWAVAQQLLVPPKISQNKYMVGDFLKGQDGKSLPPIHQKLTDCFIKHIIRFQHCFREVIVCILKHG